MPETRTEGANQYGVDYEEIMAAVLRYFCRGYTPSVIADLMLDNHGIEMKREAPYRYLRSAASRGLLQFIAPRQDDLSDKISSQFPWLEQCEVVSTIMVDDVAYRTAVMVMKMIREYSRPPYPKTVVHVGFAGGNTTRRIAEQLADLLKQPTEGLPETLVFHVLAAGYDAETPLTDPNSFFRCFTNPAIEQQNTTKIQFVMLHAPPVVTPDLKKLLLDVSEIKNASERVNEIDIIVTSAGVMEDPDSMLSKYYTKKSPQIADMLAEDQCIGDIMWLPLALSGPIDNSRYPYHSMILAEFGKLPLLIQHGTRVVLAVSPCGVCGRSKVKILDTILALRDHIITHLIVDSRTTSELFKLFQQRSSCSGHLTE